MDKTLRIMFINYTNKPLTFTITFEGTLPLEVFKMTKTPIAAGADPRASIPNEGGTSPLPVTVPAGDIRGCTPVGKVSIQKPSTGQFQVFTVAGKDPWPPPPQAPTEFQAVTDFPTRFTNFLTSAGQAVDSDLQILLEAVPAAQQQAERRPGGHAGSHEQSKHPKDKK